MSFHIIYPLLSWPSSWFNPQPSSDVFIRDSVQSCYTFYFPEVPHLHCLNFASVSLLRSPSLTPIQQVGTTIALITLSLVALLSSFLSMTCPWRIQLLCVWGSRWSGPQPDSQWDLSSQLYSGGGYSGWESHMVHKYIPSMKSCCSVLCVCALGW